METIIAGFGNQAALERCSTSLLKPRCHFLTDSNVRSISEGDLELLAHKMCDMNWLYNKIKLSSIVFDLGV